MDEWNGKFYIGKHYGDINDNYAGSGKLIREYFKEFGKERDITYEKIILEIGDENNICDLERYYISKNIDSELCLNMICHSSTGTLGQKHSVEAKQRISEGGKGKTPWNKGKHLSDDHKRKLSESLKGKQFSEDHKKHISEGQKGRMAWNKGKHLSHDQRRKLSETAKRRRNKQS